MSDSPEVYSREKTANLLYGAGAFARLPGGEFIAQLADQLKLAEAAVAEAVNSRVELQTQIRALKTEVISLDDMHRKQMAWAANCEMLIKRVAAGEKNPKKLAKDFLSPTPPPKNDALTPAHN